jgi:glucose-6-phosphate isomerase
LIAISILFVRLMSMNLFTKKNKDAAWQKLAQMGAAQQQQSQSSLTSLSAIDGIVAAGLTGNFKRHSVNAEVWELLLQLAHESELSTVVEQYFEGVPINHTEQRAVLHTALRRPLDQPLLVDGEDVMLEVADLHQRMSSLIDQVHQGELTSMDGKPITDIIHIGIGGSDLGPVMACEALKPFMQQSLRTHFFANVDRAYMEQQLANIDPARTLVMVVSKSFTTAETLSNARHVKQWMQSAGLTADYCQQHFYAVTANPERAAAFGINTPQILPMWDWVGGRFSIWSGVSLVLAMTLGMSQFREFLAGAYAMDQHFRSAPFTQNMPVVMALLEVWYGNFMHANTQAIIPYSDYLRAFPSYLQQMQMESLGKQVNRQGLPVGYSTGRVIWGGVGTHSQHSFHQLLMQGTHCVPVDFILPTHNANGQRNDDLCAHCLAQAEVMWNGSEQALSIEDSLYVHKLIAGGRPSTMLLMPQLNPKTLGALLALYEHKVLVQSAIWDINAFDQWGVEQGKCIAKCMLESLKDNTVGADDEVSRRLLSLIKKKELV